MSRMLLFLVGSTTCWVHKFSDINSRRFALSMEHADPPDNMELLDQLMMGRLKSPRRDS